MKKLFLLLLLNTISFSQITPSYTWLNPKPFGQGIGWMKALSENTVYMAGQNGTFLKTTDGGQSFTANLQAGVAYGPANNFGYDIYAMYWADNNLVYTAGAGGGTKSTDGGQTWTTMPTLAINGTGRDIQFIDASNGFLVGTSTFRMSSTTDGGQTWVMNSNLPSTTYYAVHAFSTNKIIVAGSANGGFNVRITTDGGATWTGAAAGTGTLYALEFTDSLTAYAAGASGKSFKSTDGGYTWAELPSAAASASSIFGMHISGSNIFLVGDRTFVVRSTDGGATFSAVQFRPANIPDIIMRGVSSSGNTVYISGDNGAFYKSTDNGSTWTTPTQIAKAGFIQALWADGNGRIIAGGTAEGATNPIGIAQFMYSSDYGNTWNGVSLSSSSNDIRSLSMINSTTGYACGSGGKIYKTTNGGASWDSIYTTSIQALSRIYFYNENLGITVGNGGSMYKTTDGGVTWASINGTGLTGGINAAAILNPSTYIAGSFINGGVYKTTDGGTSWFLLPTIGTTPASISDIKFTDENNGYIIGATGVTAVGFLHKTTDGGLTWENTNFPFATTRLYSMALRGLNDFVIVGSEGNIFYTSNGGTSWASYNFGMRVQLNGQILGAAFPHPDTCIVAGAGGYVVKFVMPSQIPVELTSFTASVSGSDVTLNWVTASETNNRGFEIERAPAGSSDWLPAGYTEGRGSSAEMNSYSFTDYNLSSGSYSYRIKQLDYDGTVTVYNLAENVTIGIPAEFALMQNYPNPFNPETTIRFAIPQKEHVSISVYDILGKQVASVLNETKEAGSYTVGFSGSSLPSGVYIYTITAGSLSQSRKMTLMK